MWITSKCVKYRLPFGRQAYEYKDEARLGETRWRSLGGLYINTVDSGKGLLANEHAACGSASILTRYEMRAEQQLVNHRGKV